MGKGRDGRRGGEGRGREREAVERELCRVGEWGGVWNEAEFAEADETGTLLGELRALREATTAAQRTLILDRLAAWETPRFVSTWVRGKDPRAAAARLARRVDWPDIRRRVLRSALRMAQVAAGERLQRLPPAPGTKRPERGTWCPDVPAGLADWARWLRRRAMREVSALLVAWDDA